MITGSYASGAVTDIAGLLLILCKFVLANASETFEKLRMIPTVAKLASRVSFLDIFICKLWPVSFTQTKRLDYIARDILERQTMV